MSKSLLGSRRTSRARKFQDTFSRKSNSKNKSLEARPYKSIAKNKRSNRSKSKQRPKLTAKRKNPMQQRRMQTIRQTHQAQPTSTIDSVKVLPTPKRGFDQPKAYHASKHEDLALIDEQRTIDDQEMETWQPTPCNHRHQYFLSSSASFSTTNNNSPAPNIVVTLDEAVKGNGDFYWKDVYDPDYVLFANYLQELM